MVLRYARGKTLLELKLEGDHKGGRANLTALGEAAKLLSSLSALLVGKWQLDCHSIFVSHCPRNMTLSSQVLGKFNVPRFQRNLFAACELYFSAAAQRDHVLATRRRMPIINPSGRRPMNLGSRDLQHRGDLIEAVTRERDFDVLSVRLTVRACVKPGHDHRLARLSRDRIRVCSRPQYENHQAQRTNSD
jgi:hypothetical protein